VEAIGRNSNLGHLYEKWADLRKSINASPTRPPLLRQNDQKPRAKRFLTSQEITDIIHRYEVGDTTQQIATHCSISKARVATILGEQGITIRRQGLNDEQVREAATLYAAGNSLAQIGARFDVSHTTVAAALRRHGVQLRPRPGWC
jgi:hypothetical protein